MWPWTIDHIFPSKVTCDIIVSDSHLLFLRRFDIPFDNNLSERDLRKVKNRQKMSGGFRDESGRDMFCSILSFIETCKRRSLPVFQSICAVFNNDPLGEW